MDRITEAFTPVTASSTARRLRLGARLIAVACLATALAGCVHWPDVAEDCQSYGVSENNTPMGAVLHIEPLGHERMQEVCNRATGAAAVVNFDYEIRGCVVPTGNGGVRGYYSTGDRCAMYHEICHAKHGLEHTEQYAQDLRNDVPMPYCPRNQLRLFVKGD